jgi:hypothetical protein
MSNTLFLVMPAGRGVIVVKTAVFGILYLSCIGSFPNWCFKKLLVDEGDQCLRAREAGEVERRCLDSRAARTDVLVSQAMDPAKSADMRRAHVSAVCSSVTSHTPASRIAVWERPYPAKSPPTFENGVIAFLVMPLKIYFLLLPH